MPTLTANQWRKARSLWEQDHWTYRMIADRFGVNPNTVGKRKQLEGWERAEDADGPVVIATTDGGQIEVESEATVPASVVVPSSSEAETIRRLEQRVKELEAERAANSQDVEMTLPTDPQGWIDYMGRDHFYEIALDQINFERTGRKLNPVEWDMDHPQVVRKIDQLATEMVQHRTKWAGESNIRTLKMARKDPSSPTGWTIRAIPMEPTINNFNGGPGGAAEAIQRYVRKGFKLIKPSLCQRGPCDEVAAVVGGQLRYQGYCSEAHMMDDPFINSRLVKNVTGAAVPMAGRPAGQVLAEAGGG